MKLRYQMRGLGIGIIVTALLMGVVKGEKIPLSDAEIKVRALELGMVEADSRKLSDIPYGTDLPEGQPSGDGGATPDSGGKADGDMGSSSEPDVDSVEDGGEASEAGGESGIEGEAGDDGHDPENDDIQGEPEGSGEQTGGAEGELVTVVIEEGVTSYSVCELLEELGLIEDADSLDYYICSNSYSRSILQGVYEIPRGTSDEEIVSIIMGNR